MCSESYHNAAAIPQTSRIMHIAGLMFKVEVSGSPYWNRHSSFRLRYATISSKSPQIIVQTMKPFHTSGETENLTSIQLEAAKSKIAANPRLALRYLRLPHEPRTLWVDAICLDQTLVRFF